MIVLVRHGETEWSASGKHTSRTDLELTERGRAAARGLRLGSFALVLASPRRRAIETARLAGYEPEIEPNLAELDYGPYEGRTTAEIRETRPGWSVWEDPGGETIERAGERADRVLARCQDVGGDVALFAHGHILRVIGARWIGLPADQGRSLFLDTAAVCELGFEHEYHVLRRWNAR
jgi:broad specificity phosphatase PhoE